MAEVPMEHISDDDLDTDDVLTAASSSARTVIGWCLAWLLPPVCLVASLVRFSVMSTTYLLLFLLMVVVASPKLRSRGGADSMVLLASIVSATIFLGQSVFQIAASISDQQEDWRANSFLVVLGLIPMDGSAAENALVIVPDVCVLVISTVAWICRRALPINYATEPLVRQDSDGEMLVLMALLLCLLFSAVGAPSLINIPFLLGFFGILLVWVLRLRVSSLSSKRLSGLLVAYSSATLLLQQLFQYPLAQTNIMGDTSDYALIGLIPFTNGTLFDHGAPSYSSLYWSNYVYFAALTLQIVLAAWYFRIHNQPLSIDSQVTARLLTDENERDHDESLTVTWQTTLAAFFRTMLLLALRFEYLLALVGIVVWIFVFHSWESFALLLWLFLDCFSPFKVLRASAPALSLYLFALTLLQLVYSLPGTSSLPEDAQFDLIHPDHGSLRLGLKVMVSALVLISVRAMQTSSSLTRSRSARDVSWANEPLSRQQDPVNVGRESTIVERDLTETGTNEANLSAADKFWMGLKVILGSALDHLFLVMLLVIFITACQTVTVFNAGYLVQVAIIALASDNLRPLLWLALLCYCEAVVFLQYLWRFPDLVQVGSPESNYIGLYNPEDNLLEQTGWNVLILFIVLIQIHSSSLIRAAKNAVLPTSTSLLRRIWRALALCVHHFAFVFTYVALFSNAVSGSATAAKCMCLAALSLFLICRASLLSDSKRTILIQRLLTIVCTLVFGVVWFLMYTFQFVEVQKLWLRSFEPATLTALGLEQHMGSQFFEYLVGMTAVVVTLTFDLLQYRTAPEPLPWPECVSSLFEACRRLCAVSLPVAGLIAVVAYAFTFQQASVLGAMLLLIVGLHAMLGGPSWRGWFPIVSAFAVSSVMTALLVYQISLVNTAVIQLDNHPDALAYNLSDARWIGLQQYENSASAVIPGIVVLLVMWLANIGYSSDLSEQLIRESRSVYDSLRPVPPFACPRVGENENWSWLVRLVYHRFWHASGVQVCIVLSTVSTCVALNVFGLVQMIFAVVLYWLGPATTKRWWPTFVRLYVILMWLQYGMALAAPPSFDASYPFVNSDNYWLYWMRVWLFLPANQNYFVISANIGVLAAMLMQWRVFRRNEDDCIRAWAPFKGKRTVTGSLWALFYRCWFWISLIFAFSTGAADVSLLNFGYVIISLYCLFSGEMLLMNILLGRKRMNLLFAYNACIISLRIIWQMPALCIDWSLQSGKVVEVVNVIGLRFGMTLSGGGTAGNETVVAWSSQGILLEVILFMLLIIQKSLFDSPDADLISRELRRERRKIQETAHRIAVRQREEAKAQLMIDATCLRATRERVRLLKIKQTANMNKTHKYGSLFSGPDEFVELHETAEAISRDYVKKQMERLAVHHHADLDEEVVEQALAVQEEETHAHETGMDADVVVVHMPEDTSREADVFDSRIEVADLAAVDHPDDEEQDDDEPILATSGSNKLSWLLKVSDTILGFFSDLAEPTRFLLGRKAPPLPPTISRWQILGAHVETLFAGYSHWLVYLSLVLTSALEPCVLSVFPTMLLLCMLPVLRPRPPAGFYEFLLFYLQFCIALKYFFLLPYWTFNLNVSPSSITALVGISRDSSSSNIDNLLGYLAGVIGLLVHRMNLRQIGLWRGQSKELTQAQLAQHEASMSREQSTALPASRAPDDILSASSEMARSQTGSDNSSQRAVVVGCKNRFLWALDRLTKVGAMNRRDLYSIMFATDLLSFVVFIFGWSAFQQVQTDESQSLTNIINNVPLPFVLAMLLQALMIVADRCVYLYRAIRVKLALLWSMVFLVHVGVFFLIPTLITHRPFTSSWVLVVWYLLKCMYFFASALQIRHGYPPRVLRNMLTNTVSPTHRILFAIYRLIPFLFELRMIIDWACTFTTLKLSHWMAMEDIWAELYNVRCERRDEEHSGREFGQSQAPVKKGCKGGILAVLLVVLLFLPFLLMTLVNTTSVNIPLRMVSLSVGFVGYEPLYVSAVSSLTFNPVTSAQRDQLEDEWGPYVGTYSTEDIVSSRFPAQSESLWTITPPSRESLTNLLLNETGPAILMVDYEFVRDEASPVVAGSVSGSYLKLINSDDPLRPQFAAALAHGTGAVNVTNLFPAFVAVPVTGVASVVPSKSMQQEFVDCRLELHRRYFVNASDGAYTQWWSLDQTSPLVLPDTQPPVRPSWPQIISFSSRAVDTQYSFLQSSGIIGLYVSVVLVIGRFLRMASSNLSHQIMFMELPQVDAIRRLCEDIYDAREEKALDLEEALFGHLIYLYRSPQALIEWSVKSTKVD